MSNGQAKKMRFVFPVLTVLAVAACTPPVPDSGASGVGFDDYNTYQTRRAQRDQQLAGETTVRPPAQDQVITEITPQSPSAQTGDTQQTAVVDLNNPSISDEQDFSAVSSRESIESDRERLQAQRQNYKVIEPTAVPQRSGGSGPNIVAYAIETRNNPGDQLYRRTSLGGASRSARACAKFTSSDQAQEAFLAAGGPARDRRNLDPDGDGFACSWDPRPFRRAVN